MIVLRSLVLGIIQGLTEFLPISSSAHLILVPWLMGWQVLGPTFDVALHLGTLFSLLLYFGRDWLDLVRAFGRSLWERRIAGDPLRRMSWFLLLGCLPAALVGLFGEGIIERHFRHPVPIAILMMLMGGLLIYSDKKGRLQKSLTEIGLSEALTIGLAQALALFPGVSRSGITMTVGLLLGFRRNAAARFSFLLASPIVAGAALLKGLHLLESGLPAPDRMPFLVGILSATLFGFLSIRYLLAYLERGKLAPFAYYRWGVSLIVLILFAVRAVKG